MMMIIVWPMYIADKILGVYIINEKASEASNMEVVWCANRVGGLKGVLSLIMGSLRGQSSLIKIFRL